MADERLCNPISTQELERRWTAVRTAMPDQKLDALIVQGANNLAGTGGYFRWFTGVSMGTSYPATVIFPKDGLMTLVSHGPMGVERDFAGNDPVWRGVGNGCRPQASRRSTTAFPTTRSLSRARSRRPATATSASSAGTTCCSASATRCASSSTV